ncbi:DUF397 domain-containing protein [Streptomyces sp. P6-2-1]|uniref:DUF397 domain-containing protein n=1 Tax=unclassified Streptomyces TaxID=2593676 RepID=UPI003D367D62
MTNNKSRTWIKSTHSGGDNGDCVEIAIGETDTPVRDSKTAAEDGPVITFGHEAFGTFLDTVRTR